MVVSADRVAAVKEAICDIESKIKVELATKDPGFQVVITDLGEGSEQVVENKALSHIVDVLIAMPNGVQAMSADVEGLVQTSLNNGIMKLEGDKFSFVTSVRSSIASEKKALIDRITTITRLAGGKNDVRADYPGWAYRVESPFRDLCMKVYKDMYQKEPIVEAIHAGVECGFFLEKRPDLDCVSIGPNMKDIHTTEERLSISSAKRTWEYVLAVLAAK
jgi:dipeptidase D